MWEGLAISWTLFGRPSSSYSGKTMSEPEWEWDTKRDNR